jgi:regulator of ribonuclease activity B
MNWPNDVDGDVFRRLEQHDFNFSEYHSIDFNVDFENWPPMPEAVALIRKRYPNATIHEPRDKYQGYVQFQVRALVTYELVMNVQREMSTLMADFGGRCESWGVMQDEV